MTIDKDSGTSLISITLAAVAYNAQRLSENILLANTLYILSYVGTIIAIVSGIVAIRKNLLISRNEKRKRK